MKRNYITPVTHILALNTPSYLVSATVQSFNQGKRQTIGDVSENAKKRNMWEE